MIEFEPIQTREDFDDELDTINACNTDNDPGVKKLLRKSSRKLLGMVSIVLLVITVVAATVFSIARSRLRQQETGVEIEVKMDAPTASYIMQRNLPYLIYGTAWKKDSTSTLVKDAVLNGFRFLDTANQPKHYNEEGVGFGWTKAAVELGLERNDFFLQTKFSPLSSQDLNDLPYSETASLSDMVLQSVEGSLQHLQTDYLDALILHSPFKMMEDTLTVWSAMESLVDNGTVLQLGISNCYNYDTLTELFEKARIKPTILQNHLKTITFDPRFLQFTRENNMQYQAFWTLTSNKHHLEKTEIREMAAQKDLSPQLYMYAFLLALHITPLDGSTTHQIEDVDFILRLQNGTLNVFETRDEINNMAKALDMPLS